MELTPRNLTDRANRPCNLYKSSATCCQFSSGRTDKPERHVREALASFLVGCHQRLGKAKPCLAMDLGANNGWFSSYMLQLGAHVVSVEPQQDLAQALRDTVTLNCWSNRSVVFTGFACSTAESCPGLKVEPVYRPHCVSGYRLSYPADYKGCATRFDLSASLSGKTLEELLFNTLSPARERREHCETVGSTNGSSACSVDFEMLKLDADGPEGGWLDKIDELISHGKLKVRAVVAEGSNIRPETMHRLQHVHGYSFWRLDWLDGRRFLRPDGWDAYSPPGTFAPLLRYRAQHASIDGEHSKYSPKHLRNGHSGGNETRDLYEDEMFSIRAMRHVFRVKDNTTLHGWYRLLQPVARRGWPPQWLFTTDTNMLQATYPSVPCGSSVECIKAWRVSAKDRADGQRTSGSSAAPDTFIREMAADTSGGATPTDSENEGQSSEEAVTSDHNI